MKLLILGGSNVQYNLVKRAREKGHFVIVSDYYLDAPAKAICNYGELASTFDVEATILVAKKHNVDGIMTLGTDQPVYTAASVAKVLSLPALIDVDIAKAATNKKVMKRIFTENNIPTVRYKIIEKSFSEKEISDIRFPVVVKPLDSQGQRGVYKLDHVSDIRTVFDNVLSFSREKEILLEEYYQSQEITLSGWVENSIVHILTITDRISYQSFPHIGICTAHHFPSKHFNDYGVEIIDIANQIVEAFHIKNGPIYFQMLIGEKGIKVNEIACRIGGAYEDEFIPFITGVDILDMLIESSIGNKIDSRSLYNYSIYHNKKYLSVEMIFAKPGMIIKMNDMNEIRKLPGIVQAKYNVKEGYELKAIENATARAGFMIITGINEKSLQDNIRHAYSKLYILDKKDENLIIDFKVRKEADV